MNVYTYTDAQWNSFFTFLFKVFETFMMNGMVKITNGLNNINTIS